jgi:hypothetical protein
MRRKRDTLPGYSPRFWEARRITFQRQAQRGLRREAEVRVSGDGREYTRYRYRVVHCMRSVRGLPPEIWRSPDQSEVTYRGLVTCGSVWHCPVCAAKITSERRDELSRAIAAWTREGGAVYLLTFTHSHEKDEAPIAEQLRRFTRALAEFKGHRDVLRTFGAAGSIGAVRALEVTHGEMNGWHPHTHELVFARPGEAGTFKRLRRLWVERLLHRSLAGMKLAAIGAERFRQLRALMRHALTVQDGRYAAEYVAKFGREPWEEGGSWGLASEVTRGHQKIGERLHGRTPFTLLALAAEGDRRALNLFVDYAKAFHGRRQLFYSKGLRDRLGLGVEVNDEAIIANADKACTVKVATVSTDDWSLVLSRDARYELLVVAAQRGIVGVSEFLAALRARPPTHSGEYSVDWSDLYERRKKIPEEPVAEGAA